MMLFSYKILWLALLVSSLSADRGFASPLSVEGLTSVEMRDRIINQYLSENPPESWPYDWTTAIFLQGALASSDISSSPTQIVQKTQNRFLTWKEKKCCEITMPDLAVMGFAAARMKSLVEQKDFEFDYSIQNTENYFATEPVNKLNTFDHVGRRHRFFWWAPPTHWFVPSSIWADSIVMSVMTGFEVSQHSERMQSSDFFLDQVNIFADALKDRQTGLYKHAFYIESKKKTPTHSFWARGNGWVTYALGYLLERTKEQDPRRETLSKLLNEHVQSMLQFLDSKQGFRTLLKREGSKSNSFESSSLALFTVGVAKGLRTGAIKPETLPKDFLKSLWGISKNYLVVKDPERISVTQISGPTTSLPWDFYYTNLVRNRSDESYGVGAYLAMIEELRLAQVLK